MFEIKEKPKNVTRALITGVHWKKDGSTEEAASSLLDELGELCDTQGLEVVGRMLVKVPSPQARYIVGSGKAQEIVDQAKAAEANVIVFDNALSPGQQRNWEELSGLAVIDREEVILDIFARRARTKEARLQVALARMEYSLPRLTRAWGHLSRQQGGGLGGKGEGESQLETDRRLVRKRIDHIKAELAEVRSQRATQRKSRQRAPVPQAAIVGYTNAGKSSLLRALTGADVLIEDKLFATLDPTTRQIDLPGGQKLLLTDTVGFVRKLPHRIVEAFKATLEESVLSDFLVHVLDATSPDVFTYHRTTLNVLAELGAEEKPTLTVFNKIDALGAPGSEERESTLNGLRRHFPGALFISTHTREGFDELQHRMAEELRDRVARVELLLPPERGDLLADLHRHGHVIATEYAEDGAIHVHATLPPKFLPPFEAFRTTDAPAASAETSALPLHDAVPAAEEPAAPVPETVAPAAAAAVKRPRR